jgi:hypothetical protein
MLGNLAGWLIPVILVVLFRRFGFRDALHFQRAERANGMIRIIGWGVFFVGAALWIYGYLVTGHASLIDWQANTPWWVADYLPNIESEIGLVLLCLGTVLVYWPTRDSSGT